MPAYFLKHHQLMYKNLVATITLILILGQLGCVAVFENRDPGQAPIGRVPPSKIPVNHSQHNDVYGQPGKI